jgi:hypothetical protein
MQLHTCIRTHLPLTTIHNVHYTTCHSRGWSCHSAVLATYKTVKVDWRSPDRSKFVESVRDGSTGKRADDSVTIERCQPRNTDRLPVSREIKAQIRDAVSGLVNEFRQVGDARSISLKPQFRSFMFEDPESTDGNESADQAAVTAAGAGVADESADASNSNSATNSAPSDLNVRVKGIQVMSFNANSRKSKTGDPNDVPTLSLSFTGLSKAPSCRSSSQAMTAIISDVVGVEEASGEQAAMLAAGVSPGSAKVCMYV